MSDVQLLRIQKPILNIFYTNGVPACKTWQYMVWRAASVVSPFYFILLGLRTLGMIVCLSYELFIYQIRILRETSNYQTINTTFDKFFRCLAHLGFNCRYLSHTLWIGRKYAILEIILEIIFLVFKFSLPIDFSVPVHKLVSGNRIHIGQLPSF